MLRTSWVSTKGGRTAVTPAPQRSRKLALRSRMLFLVTPASGHASHLDEGTAQAGGAPCASDIEGRAHRSGLASTTLPSG
jgi:hypothetical protein